MAALKALDTQMRFKHSGNKREHNMLETMDIILIEGFESLLFRVYAVMSMYCVNKK